MIDILSKQWGSLAIRTQDIGDTELHLMDEFDPQKWFAWIKILKNNGWGEIVKKLSVQMYSLQH